MPKPNAFLAACPSREVLSRLGEKWTSLVIALLGQGPKRFTDLKNGIEGVSQKMLTQTLRNLERDGLVTREVDAARMPVQVVYALTKIGKDALPVILEAKQWAESNFRKVLASRDRYDRQKAGT